MSTQNGNGGTLGDVGCHIYDAVELLGGQIETIHCKLGNFDKGLENNRIGDLMLDANDSFVSTVCFGSGALGTVHASRWAHGYSHVITIAVYCDRGAIKIELSPGKGSEYRIVAGDQDINDAKWKTEQCTAGETIYRRFVESINNKVNAQPDFQQGARVQAYLHSSFLSDAQNKPVRVTD